MESNVSHPNVTWLLCIWKDQTVGILFSTQTSFQKIHRPGTGFCLHSKWRKDFKKGHSKKKNLMHSFSLIICRLLRKPLLSSTLWVRSLTRTALLSCSYSGTISLFGLLICRLVYTMIRSNLFILERTSGLYLDFRIFYLYGKRWKLSRIRKFSDVFLGWIKRMRRK